MKAKKIPCPRCNGTYKIRCSWCKGQGGWNETSAGQTKWVKCTHCMSGMTPCDAGCDSGYITRYY